MKALLLDAAPAGDTRTISAGDALGAGLAARGYSIERLTARDLDVHACTGCFGCWTRTPGECVIDDDARRVAELVINSGVTAVVTPVSFGSYGSLAKGLVDRMICLVLPHFTMVDGEVHHKPRYSYYPAWLALGTLPRHSAEETTLFKQLVERNSVNLYNPVHAAEVLCGDEAPEGAVERLLDAVRLGAEVRA